MKRLETYEEEDEADDEEETGDAARIPAKPAIDMRIFELIEYAARTKCESCCGGYIYRPPCLRTPTN
ncbi:hypothetical protein ACFTAO_00005 [Paenibacillus rhizoplanae]